jgi:hypothetical protein
MPEVIGDEERLNRAVGSLRNFIRDKKELNHLLAGNYESSDDELKQAIMSALLDFNMSPPIIQHWTLANHPNKALLIQAAAIQAVQSSGLWHSREHMPSSDGGTSADDHNKAGEYSGWVERFYADYERKKSDLKMALNIEQALNGQGLASEYGAYGFAYGYWW